MPRHLSVPNASSSIHDLPGNNFWRSMVRPRSHWVPRTSPKLSRKRAPCWDTSVSRQAGPASTSIWNTRYSFSIVPTCAAACRLPSCEPPQTCTQGKQHCGEHICNVNQAGSLHELSMKHLHRRAGKAEM